MLGCLEIKRQDATEEYNAIHAEGTIEKYLPKGMS